MMNHDTNQSRLDDYVDGLLGVDERREVELHLATCDSCRTEVADLLRLRTAVAALPREIPPPRDLWAGIAERIEEQKVIHVDFRAPRARPVHLRRATLAAAAIVLVVLSSSLTALLMRSAPEPPLAGAVPGNGPAGANAALAAFQPSEREFLRTVDELGLALEEHREHLRPETVEVVEENLRIIDRAIGEARAALEADPNNRDLTLMLSDVYQKKIDLLQNAVQISTL